MQSLLARSLAGLAFLLIVLGVVMFGSAGTLHFWRAWLYLAVFGGASALVTGYLYRHDRRLLDSRTRAGPVAETQRSQQWIQSLASLCFIGLFVVAGLEVRRGTPALPWVFSVLAEGFVALGFWIVFRVFRENSFASAVIEVRSEQRVVTTGPYALVRHPMYTGASLLLLATPPALGSWRPLPFALALVLVIALRAVSEEKTLRDRLPGYEAYLAAVRFRLLPFVW